MGRGGENEGQVPRFYVFGDTRPRTYSGVVGLIRGVSLGFCVDGSPVSVLSEAGYR